MRNRIFKYFFVSLLIVIGGILYFTMIQDNRIVVGQMTADKERQETLPDLPQNVEPLSVKKQANVALSDTTKSKEAASDAQTQKNNEPKQEMAADISSKTADIAKPTVTIEAEDNAANRDDKININTADKAKLMTLKGIGEKKAEQIINYRREKGDFKRIEDIMKIKGIKRKAFEKIKDHIRVTDD